MSKFFINTNTMTHIYYIYNPKDCPSSQGYPQNTYYSNTTVVVLYHSNQDHIILFLVYEKIESIPLR